MRLLKALDLFTEHMRADGRSVHTIGQYQRHVALLAQWLGENDDVTEITPLGLAKFLNDPSVREGKKAATVNALRTSLRVVFGWLADADIVPKDPARLVRRARCGPPPPKTLSDEEIARLLDVLSSDRAPEGKRDHVLYHLMITTGIRLSSAIAIDIEDVDLARAHIRLRRVKGGVEQKVFLGKEILPHLARFIGRRRTGALFLSLRGERVSHRHVQRRLRAWLKRADVHGAVSPHGLRHSFAMRLYARTGDLGLVQAALGHRSVMSTLIYAQADEGRLRQAMG